jgi:periplasmic protein TonB
MDLRCLVFSSDEASAPLICQALAEMGAKADHCPDAAAAIGRAASESFQIVIADWDEQPNAEYLLKAARARKPMERPLTLAVVSDDASVPKALQAGANSVLRKPILLNQVRDTLETARSLLKAKQDSAAHVFSSSQNPLPGPSTGAAANEAHLRAGDFLTSARPAPSAQFDTESEIEKEMEPSTAAIDPLKELEPMAAAVTAEPPAPAAPAPPTNEPRGLQWYLNQRTASLPSTPSVPVLAPPPPQAPELMGYEQMARHPDPAPCATVEAPVVPQPRPEAGHEQKAAAELFSYITQGSDACADNSEPSSGPGFHLGKRAVLFATVLAAAAIIAAPQAPWHPAARRLWTHGASTLHAWLNPQVVAPAQAPETHENFGRAGDEYKLPVAENIPDATTDPSQIRVVPVVDPTAKKPGNSGADQNGQGTDGSADSSSPADGQPGAQVPDNSSQPTPATSQPAGSPHSSGPTTSSALPAEPSSSPVPAAPPPATPASSNSSAASQAGNTSVLPQQKPTPVVQIALATPPIPSSLKSQMASTVPDAGGNRAPETALPSIEPVRVSESAERALLSAQSSIAYPDNAKGQQGTVILQLLIGRDGSVQDAKFLQGSLAFARAAIDGVRSWRFKPYLLNGRPVSVQTQLTLGFSPTK